MLRPGRNSGSWPITNTRGLTNLRGRESESLAFSCSFCRGARRDPVRCGTRTAFQVSDVRGTEVYDRPSQGFDPLRENDCPRAILQHSTFGKPLPCLTECAAFFVLANGDQFCDIPSVIDPDDALLNDRAL